jgi:hypothetical protein
MFETQINLLAVLVAGIANMAIGFAWYSPLLFGNQWMKLMGLTKLSMKAAQKKMGPMYGLSFIATLVTGYVLSILVNSVGALTLVEGLQLSALVWLGFTTTVQLTDLIFGGKSFKLYAINTGYQLVSLLVMGAIVTVWV